MNSKSIFDKHNSEDELEICEGFIIYKFLKIYLEGGESYIAADI